MALLSSHIHRSVFLWSTTLALIFLPFSEYLLSVAIIALSANWVLEGQFLSKFRILKQRRSIVFLLIYLPLVVGFFYSSNLNYALSELRLKLPLLILPIVFLTSKPLSSREQFVLLSFFCLAVFTASVYSAILFFKYFSTGGANVREISPFISHIRFGLMVNLAVFTSLYYFLSPPSVFFKSSKWLFLAGALWFTLFLFVLQSLTGIVVFMGVSFFILILYTFKTTSPIARYLMIVLISAIFLLSATYISHTIDDFFTRKYFNIENLPSKTVNGNPYSHDISKIQYENGYPVWLNISWDELEKEWSKRSTIDYLGRDKLNQPVKYTLIRYLTSKGLGKDSVGMSKLDKVDIELIESGVTSEIFRHHRFGIYPRLYQFLWEIDQYLILGQVNGSPFIQRIVYIKAAISIIKTNFWFGVGTGDLVDEFNNYYAANENEIDASFRFLSHNQLLTHWVALGFFGFLTFLAGWFLPFFIEKRYNDFLSVVFIVTISLSMLNEDTLQTHVGVCLTSLFYSILIFGKVTNSPLIQGNGPEKD